MWCIMSERHCWQTLNSWGNRKLTTKKGLQGPRRIQCIQSDQLNCHTWLRLLSAIPWAGREGEFCMFFGRNLPTTNTFQLVGDNSFSGRLLGPGRECKQIRVGCQLPSLLKDKLSIQRMPALVAHWTPPPGQVGMPTISAALATAPCQSLSSSVTDNNRDCSISAETALTGTPCQPLTPR